MAGFMPDIFGQRIDLPDGGHIDLLVDDEDDPEQTDEEQPLQEPEQPPRLINRLPRAT